MSEDIKMEPWNPIEYDTPIVRKAKELLVKKYPHEIKLHHETGDFYKYLAGFLDAHDLARAEVIEEVKELFTDMWDSTFLTRTQILQRLTKLSEVEK